MNYDPSNPLIVQGDRSILVEVDNSRYAEARDALAPFAELEKSPEHIHTYRLTNLSLWNAAAAGMTAQAMIEVLERYSKFPLPSNLPANITGIVGRYGRVRLERVSDRGVDTPRSPDTPHSPLRLVCPDRPLLEELIRQPRVREFLGDPLDETSFIVDAAFRGVLKQALISVGYPAEDLAGYTEGAVLPIRLRTGVMANPARPFHVRDYQREAAEIFYAGGDVRGGSGVIVLPCGAGKTIVGLAAMALLQRSTLVLTTSITAVKQWRRELLDKTDLPDDQIAEYTGESKAIGPVTLATYQILTHRPDKKEDFPHFKLFDSRDWGLIIYDEVHLLPAPVFRATADIQARRRLGLTATLVREDGHETDVFSLIGPKKYDVPWRDLEKQGWIATATCTEVRLPLPAERRLEYATAPQREKYRVAAENPLKLEATAALVARHRDDQVLIIGQYLEQPEQIARRFEAPLITGKVPSRDRERLYQQFRTGEVKLLVVSKVANFSIDLPDANVAIQVSGTYGSRQEEAQRLGRILRPKKNGVQAHFYALVTRDTLDQTFAANRQLFLTEQGYRYTITDHV